MTELARLAWPPSRVVEALESLANARGLPVTHLTEIAPTWAASELDAEAFDRWVDAGAAWLGLDAEPIDVEHWEVESLLTRAAPALLRSPTDGSIFVILKAGRSSVVLLGPEREVVRVPTEALRDLLCAEVERPVASKVDAWLGGVVDDPRRRARARAAIARELLEKQTVARGWLLRLPASASFWAQLRANGLLTRAAMLVGAHTLQYALSIYAWYALGSGAFSGAFERDWLILWALLCVSSIPVQIFSSWLQGQILREAATLLKRRLLEGTLRVDLDLLRRSGAGQMWGRAMDAGALEGLALSGGLFAVLSIVEFVILCGVMATGPGGVVQVIVFIAWAAATLATCARALKATRRWTDARRDMTSDLIEQMVGHRTRLAQLPPEKWHDGEDEVLERYHALSRTMDGRGATVSVMHQAWYVVALASLVPVLIATGTSAGGLAVAIGGMLLGASAISRLTGGFGQIASAATAWEQVKPLFEAGGRADALPSPEVVAARLSARATDREIDDDVPVDTMVLDASDLTFAYPGRPQPVLRAGTMKLRSGDRALLEGPSGGGKSTFAAMLSGARKPQSGLLLLEGLDWQTVGPAEWRRRVAAAPQYHENHILSETMLFNLLMGRTWPPSPKDIADAERVCQELGLGDLLARMPAGIMQMLGDTGWRLSHGERSRVYIARTLLQGAEVVILDETFAALDPKTVEQCLKCVLQRAPTLVVIAHP